MTAATEISPAASAKVAAPSRIGPFEILGRLGGDAGAGIVSLSVVGTDGSAFAGRAGVAQCFSAPKDEAGRERLAGLLAKLVGLDHPALAAPIHADVAGNVAYVVNPALAEPAGGPAAPLPPCLVAEHLLAVSAALETAHRAGYSHGDLSRRTVALGEEGPVVGGWSLFGRGPAADQLGLAHLVIDWLAGSPFVETTDADDTQMHQRRLERLRRHLDGLTEQLVLVVARATDPEPADRYPSVTDFVAAFQQAVTRSAEDLVHGGFEAISNRAPQVASLMAASAERYDPQAPGLDLLKLQLGGTGVPYSSVVVPPGLASAVASPVGQAPGTPGVMAGLDPALTAGIPPEMLALIAPPIPTAGKPRNNPWLVMIVGAAGLVLLLMIGLAIVFFAGSS